MNNEKSKCMTHRLVIVMKSITYNRHYFLSNEHTHTNIFSAQLVVANEQADDCNYNVQLSRLCR